MALDAALGDIDAPIFWRSEVEQAAVTILNAHRTMAISTLRPDGWPQTTFVGYANEGFDIFFVIFRTSQKFANIGHDRRVSIAVGEEPASLPGLQAVYAAAEAAEVTDRGQREYAWKRLSERHPNLLGFELPGPTEAAIMRATCKFVSALDFTQGPGHKEELTLGTDGPLAHHHGKDEWGSSAAARRQP
jgi:hypothetical protein